MILKLTRTQQLWQHPRVCVSKHFCIKLVENCFLYYMHILYWRNIFIKCRFVYFFYIIMMLTFRVFRNITLFTYKLCVYCCSIMASRAKYTNLLHFHGNKICGIGRWLYKIYVIVKYKLKKRLQYFVMLKNKNNNIL